MGSVTAAGRPTGVRTRRRCRAETAPSACGTVGTGLVPVTAAEPGRPGGFASRPSAPFLAQVIAASQHLPQARERRRAEPREATAAYRAAARST